MSSAPKLELKGFQYADLFSSEGLASLDYCFQSYLKQEEPRLFESLEHYRHHSCSRSEQTVFILELAPRLEYFLGELFNISEA